MPYIQMSWTPVNGANGYRIHCGTVSGVYTEVSANITPGSATLGTISVPSNGTWYCVVAALDANGYEGPPSTEVTKMAGGNPPTGDVVLAFV